MASTAPFSTANPMEFTKGEPTAAERTWVFHLTVAASGADGVGLVPVATISKAGGAFAAVDAGTAITELTNGWYKIVHAAADLDTVGALGVRIAVATADTLCVVHAVTRFDRNKTIPGAISCDLVAQAGANLSITLNAAESATDGFHTGSMLVLIGGTGSGQVRECTGYVGATKVAAVDRAWATNPDNTSVYAIVADNPAAIDLVTLKDGSLTAAKISGDALAAMSGKLESKPLVTVGTLTALVTVLARSMRKSYDAIITLAGVFNGATVRVETTADENAAAPVWTDRSAGGLVADGSVTLTGPYSAWRARVSAGAVTSVIVKSSDRVPLAVQ